MNAVPKQLSAKAVPSQKTMNIGAVLERLQPEFPDLTVSRIRYYETEGLISPRRTDSRYRRFTEADIERVRYILVNQRDNYLPLKVIKEQLDAMDDGTVTAIMGASGSSHALISPQDFKSGEAVRLTDADVAQRAGVDREFVSSLVAEKIISPDTTGLFTADDAVIASTAQALAQFGLDVRHVKQLKHAADRQSALISQVATRRAAKHKEDAALHAEDLSMQLSSLVVSLHAAFVKNGLRD
ncbi:MerR family transcriptional regulator [Corynebacterium mendelii]|uniref:transcriptional regulator FtsR n=1 Tax=Corynebacterium mendelii TaxID=2765362 RepID=UPI00363C8C80